MFMFLASLVEVSALFMAALPVAVRLDKTLREKHFIKELEILVVVRPEFSRDCEGTAKSFSGTVIDRLVRDRKPRASAEKRKDCD
jgi:hypothetical protein